MTLWASSVPTESVAAAPGQPCCSGCSCLQNRERCQRRRAGDTGGPRDCPPLLGSCPALSCPRDVPRNPPGCRVGPQGTHVAPVLSLAATISSIAGSICHPVGTGAEHSDLPGGSPCHRQPRAVPLAPSGPIPVGIGCCRAGRPQQPGAGCRGREDSCCRSLRCVRHRHTETRGVVACVLYGHCGEVTVLWVGTPL